LSKDGWIDLNKNIKVSTSDFEECNMTLIVSLNEAILVDTGYKTEEAIRVLDYLKTMNIELTGIVITHYHIDHYANLDMFKNDELEVYDNSNTVDGQILPINGLKVSILKTPGHFSLGDISVNVEDEILICGDILYSCLPPQLCYGSNPELLINTLKNIEKKEFKWIIPGHGRIMSGKAIISMSFDYIERLFKNISMRNLEVTLSECTNYFDYMVIEPSLDLHRQNIEELSVNSSYDLTSFNNITINKS
jgi:glyoxylase-like metal-dependent hydrolase (beta-lactamase superfamily II)